MKIEEMDRKMIENMIIKLEEDNNALIEVNTKLLENQSNLRDSIAREIFKWFLENNTNSEQAAIDAYHAADVMMRIR